MVIIDSKMISVRNICSEFSVESREFISSFEKDEEVV